MITAIQPYIAIMRLHRPIGNFLLLWPTLIALWLASQGYPNLHTLGVFVAGVFVMRAAGCVINDYADRDLDAHVTRTKQRPLATKQISLNGALTLFFGLLMLAFLLVLQLSRYTILLSVVAAALAGIYPFTKRYMHFPQLILGLAFAWSIPMAYAQVQGAITTESCLLFIGIISWVIAYDTQYAMTDKEDDLKVGIKSTAIAFGAHDKKIIFALQLCTLACFILIGFLRGFKFWYYLSLIIPLALAIYQQYLIRQREPENCFKAFLNNNYFGAALFVSIIVGYMPQSY